MDITDRSIAHQVSHTIAFEDAATINVDGVVRDIIDTYGLVDVDDIENDEYWAIIARHDSTQRTVVPTAISCNTCNHLIRVDEGGYLRSHKGVDRYTKCSGSGRHYSFVLPHTP